MRVAAAPAIEKRIFVVRERQLMLDDYCELTARGTATTGRPEADEVPAGSGD